jgi:hypothetical protein
MSYGNMGIYLLTKIGNGKVGVEHFLGGQELKAWGSFRELVCDMGD